jgi:hypothetical protein
MLCYLIYICRRVWALRLIVFQVLPRTYNRGLSPYRRWCFAEHDTFVSTIIGIV